MCITTKPARLSKTQILAMTLDNGNHLLAYCNRVKNISGQANAMILAVPGEVNQSNFYDTTEYNQFLKNLEAHIKPKYRSMYLSKSLSLDEAEVFDNGIYTVVISKSADAIKNALEASVPAEKRPEISSDLLNFFADHYKDWNLVVCCFSGDKEMEAQPIMFEYKPFYPDYLYFPGMDAHNGDKPDLSKQVPMDHTIIFSIKNETDGTYKIFKQEVPEILKNREYKGTIINGPALNGDWYVNIKEAQNLDYYQNNIIRSQLHPQKTELIK